MRMAGQTRFWFAELYPIYCLVIDVAGHSHLEGARYHFYASEYMCG